MWTRDYVGKGDNDIKWHETEISLLSRAYTDLIRCYYYCLDFENLG